MPDTLSKTMRGNLLGALRCDPRPYTRVHYSQAKALEKRGLVRVEMSIMSHSIDLMLGSADIWLTPAGRVMAQAIKDAES